MSVGYMKYGDRLYKMSSGISPRNLGEVVTSLLPLQDASLHLANGALLSLGGVYSKAVTDLASLYDKFPNAGCWTTEEEWQASVSSYGVCGKWVVNKEANTVRIPKVTGFIEGTIVESALGELVEAGLPNITGYTSHLFTHTAYSTTEGVGAVYNLQDQGTSVHYLSTDGSKSLSYVRYGINASLSSSVYGNSTTVQPQSIKGYVYICLLPALSTAPADIKADIANVVNTVEEKTPLWAAHAAMPSTNYVEIDLPKSGGSIVAPADGYIRFSALSTTDTSVINIQSNTHLHNVSAATYAGQWMGVYIPVTEGDVVLVGYSGIDTNNVGLGFTYCNGSKPE